MSKPLAWTAMIGLCLSVLFLWLAFEKSGTSFDLLHGFDPDFIGDKPAAADAGMKQWTWNGDALEIDVPAEVRVQTPDQPGPATITVRGLPQWVDKVRFSDGKLAMASHDNAIHSKEPLEVIIRGTFKDYSLAVGQLKLGHVDQDRLAIRISGAGEVEGDGQVGDLNLIISGVGGADLENLVAKNARVKISGAGGAEIRPEDSADITLSGIGGVTLHGHPKTLVQHISGLGHVEKDADDGKDDN